jgi:hypothetical protein
VTAPDELAGFRREVVWIQASNEQLDSALEERVIAIEAVLAAPWPLRILAAMRLGRALRRSVAGYQGATFRERRWEATTAEWLAGR